MAIAKQVKVGGAYYKGYTLAVATASGSYTVFMSISSGGAAVNSVSILPALDGPGDTMSMFHMSGASGGNILATLGEDLPNMGAKVPLNLDFIAMELMKAGESLKLIYTNASSTPMNVDILVERGR